MHVKWPESKRMGQGYVLGGINVSGKLESQYAHLYQPLNCPRGVGLSIQLLKRQEDRKFKGSNLAILCLKIRSKHRPGCCSQFNGQGLPPPPHR